MEAEAAKMSANTMSVTTEWRFLLSVILLLGFDGCEVSFVLVGSLILSY
jgi:hypothetical protein